MPYTGNVVRWQFRDMRNDDTYTVEINPNTMAGYRFGRDIGFAPYHHDSSYSGVVGVKRPRQPVDWSFGGVVRSKTHHDKLIDWQKRPGKLRITDHLGRTFEVMVRSLQMLDRRPTGDNTWRFEYSFNCLLLRRIA